MIYTYNFTYFIGRYLNSANSPILWELGEKNKKVWICWWLQKLGESVLFDFGHLFISARSFPASFSFFSNKLTVLQRCTNSYHRNRRQVHWPFERLTIVQSETTYFDQVGIGTVSSTISANRISVTRLGDLVSFGQLFKAFGNSYFAQISHILRQIL